MQAVADIEIVRIMPPAAFWPRPKVHSAILHIVPNPTKRARILDPSHFHRFIRSLFLHRRKFLRGVMITALRDDLDKAAIDVILAEFKFAPDTRAEQLTPEQLIPLAEAVRQRQLAARPI